MVLELAGFFSVCLTQLWGWGKDSWHPGVWHAWCPWPIRETRLKFLLTTLRVICLSQRQTASSRGWHIFSLTQFIHEKWQKMCKRQPQEVTVKVRSPFNPASKVQSDSRAPGPTPCVPDHITLSFGQASKWSSLPGNRLSSRVQYRPEEDK